MSSISQLFIRRDITGAITLIIEKVTNNFVIGGKPKYITKFVKRMKGSFELGNITTNRTFFFDGCEIMQDLLGNITL